jgi:hypothetical protein
VIVASRVGVGWVAQFIRELYEAAGAGTRGRSLV